MMCTSLFVCCPPPLTLKLSCELILLVVSHPDHRLAFEVRKRGSKLKRLGDPPSDTCITEFRDFVRESSTRDVEAFIKLARGYVFQGTDRKTVCTINAEVSFFFFCCAITDHLIHVSVCVCVTDCLSSRETPGCSSLVANGISSLDIVPPPNTTCVPTTTVSIYRTIALCLSSRCHSG
jgi:hypothetical protein